MKYSSEISPICKNVKTFLACRPFKNSTLYLANSHSTLEISLQVGFPSGFLSREEAAEGGEVLVLDPARPWRSEDPTGTETISEGKYRGETEKSGNSAQEHILEK